LVRVTSLPLVPGIAARRSPGLVVDVELGLVDVDVDQGVPVGVADVKPLPADLRHATTGDADNATSCRTSTLRAHGRRGRSHAEGQEKEGRGPSLSVLNV
jgi:hypothetical protein